MKNSKYQFKKNKSIYYFEYKNAFIEYCQSKYNDCINSKQKYNFYFSFDYGESWYHINDFKEHRQIIQNQKKVSPNKIEEEEKMLDCESTNESEEGISILSILGFAFILWVGLSLYNKKVEKISFINNLNGRIFGWNSGLVRKGSLHEILNKNKLHNGYSKNSYKANSTHRVETNSDKPVYESKQNESGFDVANDINNKNSNNCTAIEDKCLLIWMNNINDIYNRLKYVNRLPQSQQDSFENIKLGIEALACFSQINNLEYIMKNNCSAEYENYKKAVIILILFKMGKEGLSN
jgi:hypothetical protein